MPSLLLLLLLCLTLHACVARPISLIQEESEGLTVKDKMIQVETLMSSKVVLSGLRKNPPLQELVKTAGTNILISSSQTRFPQEIKTKSSVQSELPLPIKPKGLKMHARLMLGSSQHQIDEAMNPRENDSVEDVVEMDYAQPHRKPPIHNEKP